MSAEKDPNPHVVCIPMKLDAFVLNPKLCFPWPQSTLSPLSQPNYTFLRMDTSLIQSDVLPFHDLHNATPATVNPRIYNLATGEPRVGRQGVYLHWMLPRFYRTGSSTGTTGGSGSTGATGKGGVMFRNVPTRWIVIRRLHPPAAKPESTAAEKELAGLFQDGSVTEFTGWVVESDAIRNINTLPRNVDIELECTPFIVASPDSGGGGGGGIDDQAEIYIGQKNPVRNWTETQDTVPRVKNLSVLNSSNPLFADYTLHNPNVFSMHDELRWERRDGQGKKLKEGQVREARVSYYVLGWHWREGQDPFAEGNPGRRMDEIVAECNLNFGETDDALKFGKTDEVVKTWLRSRLSGTRVLCHGAMYNVQYSTTEPPKHLPANEAAKKLADPLAPVTVGTTPLDAILAYVRAHHAATPRESARTDLRDLEEDILSLRALLVQQEEAAGGQEEVEDMLTADNFGPAPDSGSQWYFSGGNNGDGAAGAGTGIGTQKIYVPTKEELAALIALNEVQLALDQVSRELRVERWEMFSGWWKLVSDAEYKVLKEATRKQMEIITDLGNKQKAYARRIDLLAPPADPAKPQGRRMLLATVKDPATGVITQKKTTVEKGSQQVFYTQKDPTILLPHLENPWPADYREKLKARLSHQVVQTASLPTALRDFVTGMIAPCFKGRLDLSKAAAALVGEFFALSPRQARAPPSSTGGTSTPTPIQRVPVLPLYHDSVDQYGVVTPSTDGTPAGKTGRDEWGDTQPWFPLFLEWEVTYTHIEYKHWDFRTVRIRPDDPSRVRYGIKPGAGHDLADMKLKDHRVISGRVLILPQPGYSLRLGIEQLFATTNPDLLPLEFRDEEARKKLLAAVEQIDFLSSPMSGFTDHLVTKLNGMHIKPTMRVPGKEPEPIPAAFRLDAGYDADQIRAMGIETDKTPYSDFVGFPDQSIAPLKPVTHGQFKFTKLNIIDKFGQAISAINPAPAVTIPPLYPVLSEYYHPQSLEGKGTDSDGYANTVTRDKFNYCQYAQIPPTINQDARLRGHFLLKDPVTRLWRPALEWENPIWGWLVVNYAQHGLQVFLPTGEFYREVRLGGPSGATESPAWQPFDPPPIDIRAVGQIDQLLAHLRDETYLRAFVRMVNRSLAAIPHAPNQYAEFLNAIVGRPLALVNTGWALELATPPLRNQSTRGNAPPELPLEEYRFAVKFGSKDRVYDGLIGYYDARTGWPEDNLLDLGKLYTYFPDSKPAAGADPTIPIDPSNFPRFSPYYIPMQTHPLPPGNFDPVSVSASAFDLTKRHHDPTHMRIFGNILDPFTPLHAYSGILPIVKLQLPAWTVQTALQKMTAFFSMGPLLVTTPDIQLRYSEKEKLTADYNLRKLREVPKDDDGEQPSDPTKPAAKAPAFKGLPIPAIKSMEWNWLQPYSVPRPPNRQSIVDVVAEPPAQALSPSPEPGAQVVRMKKGTDWIPFEIDGLDNKARFEPAPYTAVEGYLQLRRPISETTGAVPGARK